MSTHLLPKRSGDAAVTATYQFNEGLVTGITEAGLSRASNVTYHPHGGIASWTAGNGTVTTIAADASFLPRPSSITSTSGLSTGTYGYDGAGNIKAMGTDIFSYDGRSRLISSTVWNGGTSYPLSYQYDQFGNLNPNGVNPINPVNNRLTLGVYDAGGNLTSYGSQRYDYDGLSRQTALNGGYERYLYDGSGERIARVTAPGAGTKLYTISPCRVIDTRNSPPQVQAPRVVQVSGACGVAADASGIVGNLTVVPGGVGGYLNIFPTGTNPATSTLNFNAGQVRANNFQLGMSGNGQVTLSSNTTVDAIVDVVGYFRFASATVTEPTWTVTLRDEANRLASEYTVPPSGQGSITRARNHLYLGNLLVATRNTSGGYTYWASDHLGTPRVGTGSNPESHKYQPFGLEIAAPSGVLPIKFAAMERDLSSGNDFDHARYQSSLLGRFLGPDLLQGKIIDPQSWNRYAYSRNNPLKYVDPNGQDIRIAVSFASGANVTRRDQIAIARSLGNSFVRSGVKNVSVFLDGNQVLGTGFDARAHKLGRNASTSLTIHGKNPEMDKAGLMGRTQLFGSKSEISLTKINEAHLSAAEKAAAIANVGAHETGHGSGALNLYTFDTQKNRGGAAGSVMETKVDPEEIAQPRDFSPQDQRFLQQCLNEGSCGMERFWLILTPTPQ